MSCPIRGRRGPLALRCLARPESPERGQVAGRGGTRPSGGPLATAIGAALALACSPALPEFTEPEPAMAGDGGQPTGQPIPKGPDGASPDAAPPGDGSQPRLDAAPDSLWGSTPTLRSPVELDDSELGSRALALIAGEGSQALGRCNGCHSVSRATLSLWSAQTRSFSSACLERTRFESQAQLDEAYRCLGEHAEKAAGFPGEAALSASTLGVYAAAAHLPWFAFLVENATVNREAQAAHASFVRDVGMPLGGGSLDQSEFDLLVEWFERGTPGLLELVPSGSAGECSVSRSGELSSELDELAQVGWRAKNRETPLLMFGCGPGETGRACLTSLPDATALPRGAGWARALPGATMRVLHDNSDRPLTSFWTRSSADGRYIASGLSGVADGRSGQFVDLTTGARIPGDFAYDPVFFPDNSGFMVQQSGAAAFGGLVCSQSVLQGSPESVGASNLECNNVGSEIGLYQQVAVGLAGDDYWAVHGPFAADDPGERQLQNPDADFDESASLQFTPILNLGNGFRPGVPVEVATPFQGDPSVSPSGRLLVTRLKGSDALVDDEVLGSSLSAGQSGYALHRVERTIENGSFSVQLEEVARLCLEGGKAVFSFDERWLVTYRYVTAEDAVELGYLGPDDSAFSSYLEQGASNLYLVDLRTGQQRRITHMAPGQYAIFPHFRSDGWLYFVVRTPDRQELFVAHDGALLLEEAEQ